MTPARKNEIVAVEVTHSSTDVSFRRTTYTRWVLCYVAEASREGQVRRVRIAGQSHSLIVGHLGVVYTLPKDKQAQAKRLAETLSYPGVEYESREALIEAVRAASAL